MIRIFFTCLWLVFFTLQVQGQGQERNFGAAFIAGLNAAQLDGDNSIGFNRLGPSLGIQGNTNLTEKIRINLEFLYSQRGSQNELIGNFSDAFKINLHYLDIPVTVNFMDWEYSDGDETYYKVHLVLGAQYGRLLNATLTDQSNITDDKTIEHFKESEYSWIAGGRIQFRRQLGFELRYIRAIGNTYLQENVTPKIRMVGQTLSFRFIYSI